MVPFPQGEKADAMIWLTLGIPVIFRRMHPGMAELVVATDMVAVGMGVDHKNRGLGQSGGKGF